jgi:NADPH:quinone reductase-like Zn-dependent oxidoreductase
MVGPGQARIDVAAVGVNFADTLAAIGFYPDAPKPPCVVCYEVPGTVAELFGASSVASGD